MLSGATSVICLGVRDLVWYSWQNGVRLGCFFLICGPSGEIWGNVGLVWPWFWPWLVGWWTLWGGVDLAFLFRAVSLGFGLGVYFRVGIFLPSPPPPPPPVNFAVGNVCRLSVCSGLGTSRLAYFGVDLAEIWYMGHWCRVDWHSYLGPFASSSSSSSVCITFCSGSL